MTSTFGWLDHDESERRKMLEVVNLFREKGTLDELGFGTIRDTFADFFFPGTSTIQTRVRYFLFIPWIYQELERDRVSSAQVDGQARRRQAQLARALAAGGEGEGTGVVGSQAGERLQRPPSVIYWAGLWRWGIRTFSGSLVQYHLSFDSFSADARRGLRSDDAEGELVDISRRNWHGGLPDPPAGLLEATSFRLRRTDAEYLQERILTATSDTFLAHLVTGRRIPSNADAPWLYPDLDRLPRELQKAIEHGRRFSLLAVGAQLIYNLLMATRAVDQGIRSDTELVERYRQRLGEWSDEVEGELAQLRNWNRLEFWAFVRQLNPNLRPATYRFADTWMTLALENPAGAADRREVQGLIANRELQLKGSLARLHSRRALERWNGESGTGRLTYRWSEGRRAAVDIIEGLTRRDPADA
jgi:hypothetical protein